MAFIKNLRRFGYDASYLRLTRIDTFDRLTRRAVFVFSLYRDKATAELPPDDPQAGPMVPMAAELQLTGEAFDRYFGKDADGRLNIERQAFVAARKEPVESWAGRLDLTDAQDDV